MTTVHAVFPLGHLAVGYLGYVVYCAVTGRPTRLPPLAVLVGLAVATQLPDLIDKPLAARGVLPGGRSLGHSLLFALPLVAVVTVVVRRTCRRDLAPAFAVGLVSHLLVDAHRALLALDWSAARYLGYPVTEPIVYDADPASPLVRVGRWYATPTLGPETVVVAVALGVAAWHLAGARRSGDWP